MKLSPTTSPRLNITETERLRLREYRHDDLDELAAMFADEETMRFYPQTKTRDESRAWIDWNLKLYADRGFGLWVMESIETRELLGDCGLTPQTVEGVTDIEIGWHTRGPTGIRDSRPRLRLRARNWRLLALASTA